MRSQTTSWILGALTVGFLLACSVFRPPIAKAWGDEPTYLAMIASLAKDHDLRFDERDLARLETADRSLGHLILHRTENGISYSKPAVAALIAAPLYGFLGNMSLVAVNSVALLIALALGFRWLSAQQGRHRASLTLFTFAGASVFLPYVVWRMSDSLQACLILIGLTLTLPAAEGKRHEGSGVKYAIAGCLLLGLTIMMRITNVFLAFIPCLAYLFRRRYRRALLLGAATLFSWGFAVAISFLLTDTTNPYRAERTTFTADTGYPAGPTAEAALKRFIERPARHINPPVPSISDRRALYSTLYFFVGRHTGILFYFPAALLLVACGLRSVNSRSGAVLLGVGAFAVFYLLWKPGNYFGGSTFIGNRYFLPGYAALLFAPTRLPSVRSLSAVWLLALLVSSSALYSQWAYTPLSRNSQGHTFAPLFRAAPFETTGQYLDGRRDLYWAGHLVTFSDPFAQPMAGWFELAAGRPATEMTIAHWEEPGPVHVRVDCHVEQGGLEVSDYLGTTTYPVTCPSSELTFELGRPWRRHGYWWNLDILQYSRALRLRFVAGGMRNSDGSVPTARIFYLGTPAQVDQAFSYELISENCPRQVIAGSTSKIELRIRNTSPRIWKAVDSIALRYVHGIRSRAGDSIGSRTAHAPDRDTAPDELLLANFDVTWPSRASEVELSVDLELENIDPFRARLGAPVFRTQVSIREPASAATPP